MLGDTLTLADTDWSPSSFALTTSSVSTTFISSRAADILIPEITGDFLLSGDVRVYMQPVATDWAPLPFQFTAFGAVYIINYAYQVHEGGIRLHYFFTANDSGRVVPNVFAAVIPTRLFRWLIIPGTLRSKMLAAGVRLNNYAEVTRYLRNNRISVKAGRFYR